MMTLVMPRPLNFFRRSIVELVSCRDMPAVGSSSRSSRGFWTRPMASSRRRLSPRDRLAAMAPFWSARPTSSRQYSASSRMSAALRHRLHGVQPEGAVTPGEGRHHDVLQQRQVGEDLRGLEDAHDTHLVDLVRLLAGDDLAVEDDGAGVGREPADADVEQRRLAGAVRPDDGMGRALLDLEIDVGQGVKAAEVLVHVGDVEDDVACRHGPTPPAVV